MIAMEEEPILEADLVDTPSSVATREFNLVLGTTVALSLVFLFLSAVFGGALMDIKFINVKLQIQMEICLRSIS